MGVTTPTQSTCLYYDHDNEASKCVDGCGVVVFIEVNVLYILWSKGM
jgi:hypothetical protein